MHATGFISILIELIGLAVCQLFSYWVCLSFPVVPPRYFRLTLQYCAFGIMCGRRQRKNKTALVETKRIIKCYYWRRRFLYNIVGHRAWRESPIVGVGVYRTRAIAYLLWVTVACMRYTYIGFPDGKTNRDLRVVFVQTGDLPFAGVTSPRPFRRRSNRIHF